MNYPNRLKRVREEMQKQNIGLLALGFGANLWYLAGIHRKSPEYTEHSYYGDYACGALIGAEDEFFLVAPNLGGVYFQNEAQDKPWIGAVRLLKETESPEAVVSEILKEINSSAKRIAVEDRLWMRTGIVLQKLLPNKEWCPASSLLEPMRMIKDQDEISALKNTAEITDQVYGQIVKFIKPGMTEIDIASEIDRQLILHGAEQPSFATGVRFTGPDLSWEIFRRRRSSNVKLQQGMAISFDFGACYNGYCSDFGRTAFCGEPPAELIKQYDIVLQGQAAAIKAMVSGKIKACQLDTVARNVIEEAGFGKYFVHRLGHGVGTVVHEPPFIDTPDKTTLQSGMIFAIEPSINDPAAFGCRIEDIVLVTERGGEKLTSYPGGISIV